EVRSQRVRIRSQNQISVVVLLARRRRSFSPCSQVTGFVRHTATSLGFHVCVFPSPHPLHKIQSLSGFVRPTQTRTTEEFFFWKSELFTLAFPSGYFRRKLDVQEHK
ncbi:unnamed protein product, partial [Ectocarpus sp. 12 AP-2014]